MRNSYDEQIEQRVKNWELILITILTGIVLLDLVYVCMNYGMVGSFWGL